MAEKSHPTQPTQNDIRMTVTMPEAVRADLHATSERTGVPMSRLLVRAWQRQKAQVVPGAAPGDRWIERDAADGEEVG